MDPARLQARRPSPEVANGATSIASSSLTRPTSTLSPASLTHNPSRLLSPTGLTSESASARRNSTSRLGATTTASSHAEPARSSSRADTGRSMASSKSHSDADGLPYAEGASVPTSFIDNAGQGVSSALAGQAPSRVPTPTSPLATTGMPQSSPPRPTARPKRPSISPTLPGTNQREYSLRRVLFARNVASPTQEEDIGPGEAGSGRPSDGGDLSGSSEDGRANKSGSVVAVSSVDGDGPSAKPPPASKSSAAITLPSYYATATRKRPRGQELHSKFVTTFDLVKKKVLRTREIHPTKDGRHLDLDASRTQHLIDERTNNPYITNAIRSSRYTLWNFLPRQLVFQFGKVANFYFLIISILQMIPGLSTTGTYTTIVPLLIFISISMAKEGYDDIRRYKLDKTENTKITSVLRAYNPGQGTLEEEDQGPTPSLSSKQWEEKKWQDVRVGDIIELERDEPVPADLVLLRADGPNGIAFIETMALDGETNLKAKQASPMLAKRCQTLNELVRCKAHIVTEDPNIDLYSFDGRVTVDGETLPLTTNEIVYRGSIVRNTAKVIGMVINTGEECKIRMNANKDPRIKAPSLQRLVNRVVVVVVFFVLALAASCTIAYQFWADDFADHAWYVRNAGVPFGPILSSFVIMFNTMIPLSLYVSLEIIKVGQLLLMNDVDMYDPVSNTPMESRTTTINEELGQISYIFSDKTGTLTDNVMRFRKMSVAGTAWLHDFDLQTEAGEPVSGNKEKKSTQKAAEQTSWDAKQNYSPYFSADWSMGDDPERHGSISRRPSSASLWKSSAQPTKAQSEPTTEDLLEYLEHKPHGVFARKAKFFLLSIALCHTCLPETQEDGRIDFQAASPDELALVRAAQELGYMVIDRESQTITLKTRSRGSQSRDVTEIYEVLDVIEFSSKRKCMSIIVRFPDGRRCIFCKGADSAVMKRLKQAPTAMQKAANVRRRSSVRKSLEAERALRKMSDAGLSVTMRRSSIAPYLMDINGLPRRGSTAHNLQPIRDELDIWLTDREQDVDLTSVGRPGAFGAHRASIQSEPRRSFSSSEPRSSVDWNEDYYDGVVSEEIAVDEAAVFERTFQHIDDFATEGLRTLLYGYRFLDEKEYTNWKKVFLDASTSLVNRQALIEEAGDMIEQEFVLAGATAIEDKLQKGVPETIDKLRRANIKMWMLTGDKRETAINIGQSCRLIKDYSNIVILNHAAGNVENLMKSSLVEIRGGGIPHSVVVVDGQTLSHIDSNEDLTFLFYDLAVIADSVICCRASPSQKASLVKGIRQRVNKSVTLAIGDGANDIAMIQEAHVGIGITGKEGLQAARISDYSIAQFRFLQKLLLVHGRWNYVRTGKYILGTFWKEMLFYLTQAFYQRWNGYTGTSLYEPWSLSMFNTLFTSLPVILLGIFEQDLSATTLLAVPELYSQGQRNAAFNFMLYFRWMFMAAVEALLVFFLMQCLYALDATELSLGLFAMGDLSFSCCVIIINTKLLFIEMHYKTWISAGGWLVSVIGWTLWNVCLSAVYSTTNSTVYAVRSGFIKHFGGSPKWWFVVIFITQAVLVFEIGFMTAKKTFWPEDVDIWQILEKDEVIQQRLQDAAAGETSGATPTPTTADGNSKGKAASSEMAEGDDRDSGDSLTWPGGMIPLVKITTVGSAETGALGGRDRRPSTGQVAPREF